MKVYGAPQSPFARKVRVFAMETGQAGTIEWVMVPLPDRGNVVPAFNPLVKIPVMERDDGSVLYDSPVICEYLDSLHQGPKLHPAGGEERWTALRLQALGDGIGDATAAIGAEGRRPPEYQFDDFVQRQTQKINNGLDVLEKETALLEGELTVGQLSVACAIGYLDFRSPDFGWRDTRPKLASWFETFSARPSIAETVPQRP